MKKTVDPISADRMKDLHTIANGLYGTIVGLCEDPFEAISVLTMIHLMIWMNNRAPNASTEEMLKDYDQNFMCNFEANEALRKGEMN